MSTLDIVIPVHNEEESLAAIVEAISKALAGEVKDFNIIFVDDGSRDNSWQVISAMAESQDWIRGIKLSRNFGKDAAIFAGLEASQAPMVVTMDADGQHPAEYLPQMLAKQKLENAAIVNAAKRERGKESLFYKALAYIFNILFFKASGIEVRNSSDFKLLTIKAKNEVLKCNDYNIFYRALCNWIGLKQVDIEFDVVERKTDQKSWRLASLIKFALDAFVFHSGLPIRIILWLGILVMAISVYLIGNMVWHYIYGTVEQGYPTLVLLLLLNSGLSLISIGIVGLYQRSALNQTVQRPRFIVEESKSSHQTKEQSDT